MRPLGRTSLTSRSKRQGLLQHFRRGCLRRAAGGLRARPSVDATARLEDFAHPSIVIVVFLLLLFGCSREIRINKSAPAQSRAEDAAAAARTVCHALESDAGAVSDRFAPILHNDQQESVVLVIEGDATKVTSYMGEVGLVGVRSEACPNGVLIVFVPGVDELGAAALEKALTARDGGWTTVRERHFFLRGMARAERIPR